MYEPMSEKYPVSARTLFFNRVALATLVVLLTMMVQGANSGSTLKDTLLSHLAVQKTKQCDYRNMVKTRPKPMRSINIGNNHKPVFKNAEQYAAYMHAYATRYYFGNSPGSDKKAIDLAVEWANASAHENAIINVKSVSSKRYPTYMVIGSTLNALFLLEQSPYLSDARRQTIWRWIDGLVKKSNITRELPRGGAGYQDKEQRVNNHNGRRATILAYYAAHKNDTKLLNKSNKWIKRSFGTIKNGIIYDANRGDWALNYIDLGVAALSEHTAFYSVVANDRQLESKQKDINEVADFLFRETLNPKEVHKYAKQNVGRGGGAYGGKQNIWWNKRYTSGLTHYAWIDAGMLYKAPPLPLPGPRYSEIGGYVNCWF